MPAASGGRSSSSSDAEKALRDAAQGLSYPSESDRPVTAFLWKGTGASAAAADPAAKPTADDVTAGAGLPARARVRPLSLARFWDPVLTEESWWGDEEKATAGRFRALQAALAANLSALAAFRVSGASDDGSLHDLYVVGRTADGDLAGIATQVVET